MIHESHETVIQIENLINREKRMYTVIKCTFSLLWWPIKHIKAVLRSLFNSLKDKQHVSTGLNYMLSLEFITLPKRPHWGDTISLVYFPNGSHLILTAVQSLTWGGNVKFWYWPTPIKRITETRAHWYAYWVWMKVKPLVGFYGFTSSRLAKRRTIESKRGDGFSIIFLLSAS